MDDTHIDNLDKFRKAMLETGLTPPDYIYTDGEIHRFGQDADKDTPCWYIYHPDSIPAGAFGCWKRDANETWCSKSSSTLTSQQRQAYQNRIKQMRDKAKQEQQSKQLEAAKTSEQRWANAGSVNIQHPYLSRKHIRPYKIKQEGNCLLIPIYDSNESLVNLQVITPDGDKYFTKGAQKKGCFCLIGEATDTIYIVEGYATGATIHETTKQSVVIAFDANNLLPVTETIKKLLPKANIIIAADNDHNSDINTGLTKAQEASSKLSVQYTYPQFNEGDSGSDFNDHIQQYGIERTIADIEILHSGPAINNIEADILRLATLSAIEYDQVRLKEATKLNVRVSTLDESVEKLRKTNQHSNAGEFSFMHNEEASEMAVNGARLASDIYNMFDRHLVTSHESKVALTLWIIASYCIDAFRIFPKLCITSPQKRCGKTTCLELLRSVVKKPLPSANATPASIFRAIDLWQPTLLIDEGDTFLGNSDELRGIINAGHTRHTAFVLRTEGEGANKEPKAFSVWAPMTIAMIGTPPDTIADRSVFIKLKRKSNGDKITRIPLDLYEKSQSFRKQLMRWSTDNASRLALTAAHSPITNNDRAADNWDPLFRVAKLLSDSWYEQAQRACIRLIQSQSQSSDDSDISLKLLEDIRMVFMEFNLTRIHSSELLEKLLMLEESPWLTSMSGHSIDAHWIARKLAPYGIGSSQIKIDLKNRRGYRIDDFLDAWQRYLPCTLDETPALGATPATELNNKEKEGSTLHVSGATSCYPLPQSIEKVAPQVLPAT